MPDMQDVILALVGAAAAYYAVTHFLRTGKPA